MSKRFLSIVLALLFICLGLMACAEKAKWHSDITTRSYSYYEPEEGDLYKPVVNWWKLVDIDGSSVFLAEISNPNPVAIDFMLDVDFSLNGSVVGSTCGLFQTSLASGESCLMGTDYQTPSNADSIKVGFIYVIQSSNRAGHLNYVKEQVVENGVYLEYDIPEFLSSANISVLFYQGDAVVGVDTISFYSFSSISNHTFSCPSPFDSYVVYTSVSLK